MSILDKRENFLIHGKATDRWAIGDALYFPFGVTDQWQMRPAIDSDAPYPHLKHARGTMLLVRMWPGNIIFYQAVPIPAPRRKLTVSNCAWAVKRELRCNGEFRRIVADLDAGKPPQGSTDRGPDLSPAQRDFPQTSTTEAEAPATRHRKFTLMENGITHKVPRPDFEFGDDLYFGECIPAGWQIRPTIESDIPVGLAHATKPFILLRKFPGLMTYREFINLPSLRQRSKNLSQHGEWAWRRVCRKDSRKVGFIAQMEETHAKAIAAGTAWPEGQPDQWPEGTVTKWQ